MSFRYFIEIAYKGTDFHGWQIQLNGTSIQESIQNGLRTLFREKMEIVGAGRTDTGVHAKQMFAHIDTVSLLDENDLAYKLNSILPKSILIRKITRVAENAHARFDALSRSYEYHIHLAHNPFLNETSWQIPNKEFDIVKMNEASKFLLHHTNFKAFSKTKTDVKTYDCTITNAEWIRKENELIFYITANRFLRNMVRAIVGTLLDVGEGKMHVTDFEKVILSKNRKEAGLSVPAKGLFLTAVTYPNTIFI